MLKPRMVLSLRLKRQGTLSTLKLSVYLACYFRNYANLDNCNESVLVTYNIHLYI